MACTHPSELLTKVTHPKDGRFGLECRGCGTVAYAGDSIWRAIWRDFMRWLRK